MAEDKLPPTEWKGSHTTRDWECESDSRPLARGERTTTPIIPRSTLLQSSGTAARGGAYINPFPAHSRPFSRQPRVGCFVRLGFSVRSGPRPSSAILGLSLVATGAARAWAASRGGGMLSAARRIQAYWPSRAEIRKATWFSGAVEEAGLCVGHALLPPLPSRPCAPVWRVSNMGRRSGVRRFWHWSGLS